MEYEVNTKQEGTKIFRISVDISSGGVILVQLYMKLLIIRILTGFNSFST